MKINKNQFLQTLSSAEAGLASSKEIIEQSTCFIFKDGEIISFNEEVSVRTPSGLDESFLGAVHARPLQDILSKYPDDEVDISSEKGKLVIKGKGKRTRIRVVKDILLPIDSVETPKNWTELHKDFADAITIVQECASKDETTNIFTCIHLTPDWIESCDNFQACRYTMKTGLKESSLIKKDSLSHLISLGVTEVSEGDSWVHFRNSSGIRFSCRKWMDDYKDLTPMLNVSGEEITLPKGLSDAAFRGQVFSADNKDSDLVKIDLRPGKLRLHATGITGDHEEFKAVKYNGKAMSFLISPTLLGELTKKHTECQVSPNRLKIDGPRFVYVCLLYAPAKEEKPQAKEEEE